VPHLDTRRIAAAPDAIAPDGSEVRVLCATARGGMAVFTLAPGAVARAVAHRTVEEIWYVLAGVGRMWRKLADQESVVEVGPGTSLTIPTGARFQFRCDGDAPLVAVAATMPPWPGEGEVLHVDGVWSPTV
jgi:mannose-6-phosphate isomerase-like protein (cupin superfamily)